MKAETLPAVHQADLAQASGKGALHGSTDAGVAELVNALNALSVGVQEAAQGSGVQDKELAEVLLVNLQIVPGQPAHKAAIDAVQAWTGLEEQEEFATALLQDSQDELMARVNSNNSTIIHQCTKYTLIPTLHERFYLCRFVVLVTF